MKIDWTSTSKFVDIDTGEYLQISKVYLKKEYIIIKTNKHVKYNEQKTKGYIEYTNECRRKPKQGELYTNSERTNT